MPHPFITGLFEGDVGSQTSDSSLTSPETLAALSWSFASCCKTFQKEKILITALAWTKAALTGGSASSLFFFSVEPPELFSVRRGS